MQSPTDATPHVAWLRLQAPVVEDPPACLCTRGVALRRALIASASTSLMRPHPQETDEPGGQVARELGLSKASTYLVPKLFINELLSFSVQQVLILDTDVVPLADVCELYDGFAVSTSRTEEPLLALGYALEQQGAYRWMVNWSSPYPDALGPVDESRGFNGGVGLQRLDRLRGGAARDAYYGVLAGLIQTPREYYVQDGDLQRAPHLTGLRAPPSERATRHWTQAVRCRHWPRRPDRALRSSRRPATGDEAIDQSSAMRVELADMHRGVRQTERLLGRAELVR